jgi:hypothetical protein
MLKQEATVSSTALEAAVKKVWQSSKEVEGQLTQQLDRLQANREAALCKVNAMFDELAASLGEAAKTKTEALTLQAQGLEREGEALDRTQAIEGMDEQARPLEVIEACLDQERALEAIARPLQPVCDAVPRLHMADLDKVVGSLEGMALGWDPALVVDPDRCSMSPLEVTHWFQPVQHSALVTLRDCAGRIVTAEGIKVDVRLEPAEEAVRPAPVVTFPLFH